MPVLREELRIGTKIKVKATVTKHQNFKSGRKRSRKSNAWCNPSPIIGFVTRVRKMLIEWEIDGGDAGWDGSDGSQAYVEKIIKTGVIVSFRETLHGAEKFAFLDDIEIID